MILAVAAMPWEMENLVNELFASSDVNHSPDGKTVIAILSQTEIDHLF